LIFRKVGMQIDALTEFLVCCGGWRVWTVEVRRVRRVGAEVKKIPDVENFLSKLYKGSQKIVENGRREKEKSVRCNPFNQIKDFVSG
jgi:hypothetical protein